MDPMNPLWHGILGFVIGVLGVISIVGNGMIIYIFRSTKSLRTPSNLLVVNLAFSDFLMMVAMSPAMVINCYYETWVLGPFMCEFYAMRGSLFGCVSIWTMTMIALDRHNVIVKTAMLRILFTWIFSLAWTIAPFFGWNRYIPEGNMTACGTDYLSKDWTSRSLSLCTQYLFTSPFLSPSSTHTSSSLSHPKYKVALQKFPSLSCAPAPEDTTSIASGATTTTEEKVPAA